MAIGSHDHIGAAFRDMAIGRRTVTSRAAKTHRRPRQLVSYRTHLLASTKGTLHGAHDTMPG